MDSGLSEGEEGDVDFSRLKRFKKAYKVLNSMRARQAINNLQARLKYLLGALIISHVACFAVSFILINSSLSYIEQIDYAGQAARISMSALTDVRNIQYAAGYKPGEAVADTEPPSSRECVPDPRWALEQGMMWL